MVATVAAVKSLLRAQTHAPATLEQKTYEEGYVLPREGGIKEYYNTRSPQASSQGTWSYSPLTLLRICPNTCLHALMIDPLLLDVLRIQIIYVLFKSLPFLPASAGSTFLGIILLITVVIYSLKSFFSYSI